jgi:hypothetical protein
MSFGSEVTLGVALLAIYAVATWPLWKIAKASHGSRLMKNYLGLEYLMLAHIATLLVGVALVLDAFLHQAPPA